MSESFKEKLARLRREGATPAQPSPLPGADRAPTSEPPQWWRARMQSRNAPPAAPSRELGAPADLVERRNERGSFAERVTRFAVESRHGCGELLAAAKCDASLFALLTGDERLASLDPTRAAFLDIETTGLAGGAGSRAFLVGVGVFEGGEFVLRQGFLRGPEEEAALLHDVAERVASSLAMVTFFGKSFDRHRLEDKMRVHGVAPPFAGRAHLDLYHPLRALYRPALADARLGTLERALCGVERDDDLSGAFAPEAWRDYLAGRPHRLGGVFAHNRDDVLSLVTLCAHLGAVELAPNSSAERILEAARLRGLARALARVRRWSECARLANLALAAEPPAPIRDELLELAALAERRARSPRAGKARDREV